ncbi:glutathione S-transferase family protein [Kiloniella antarctica]|uniref:glutathione transferase n=1 Tax=Kiloniella antarctica TaxID=1550907 RepID=A0ABW5BMI4_9PROT
MEKEKMGSKTKFQTTPSAIKTFVDSEFELVSFNLCPYVQRSVIVLEEKNIAYKRIDIDLSSKPDWFQKISPLGKVPLLKSNQGVLFESAIICEYLDEITENTIHPTDSFEKARHRSWIEFGSSILAGIAGFYSARDCDSFYEKRDILSNKFEQLEQQLSTTTFFASDSFMLIDAVYGPIFRYFDVLQKFLDFDFFATTPKVSAYRKNLMNRPSVRQAVSSNYHELLIAYLIKKETYLSSLMQKQAA